MREITFCEADVQAIGHDRYHHPHPRVQRYLEMLWLKHHGFSHERIAPFAGVSRTTVQRCLTAYLEGGLQRDGELAAKGSHSELVHHRSGLEEHFAKLDQRSVRARRH